MIASDSKERTWGRLFVLYDEPTYKLKSIEAVPGGGLSYQCHHKRFEAWNILKGIGVITYNGEDKKYTKRESVLIP